MKSSTLNKTVKYYRLRKYNFLSVQGRPAQYVSQTSFDVVKLVDLYTMSYENVDNEFIWL